MPESTPYYGILKESGIWPLEEIIAVNKMMLYYDIITSNEKRIARKVLIVQKETNTRDAGAVTLKK